MNNTKLMVIGGFLGSGKTTSILRAAEYLMKNGKKVGIVTNDQGSDLVDTRFLTSSGLSVHQVEGGCFCTNLDDFINDVENMAENQMPDVILAEPIGSSSDLIGKVFKPFRNKDTNIILKPLSVVVDPKRLNKLMIEKNSSFKSEINYLFRKQLEEANFIILNKIDKLSQEKINSMINFLNDTYPGAEVITISAKDNISIDLWIDKIMNEIHENQKDSHVDVETFSKANEDLSWLNVSVSMVRDEKIDINEIISSIMENIRCELTKNNNEIGHLKIFASSDDQWSKASLTSVSDEIDFSKKADVSLSYWDLIINARVNIDIEPLMSIIKTSTKHILKKNSINIKHFDMQ